MRSRHFINRPLLLQTPQGRRAWNGISYIHKNGFTSPLARATHMLSTRPSLDEHGLSEGPFGIYIHVLCTQRELFVLRFLSFLFLIVRAALHCVPVFRKRLVFFFTSHSDP